ncbi:hypothetical protein COHA_000464 [Chlorella ohadii]|uniref:non-specific serine/threonine protein kinase n=1 Tax=Chlorella ohadii TaxID=2649997 RepID=A0AAD5DZZ4_9CHLO|nr:hypothetical protein COHA_000464 [Chlorella ohadii]
MPPLAVSGPGVQVTTVFPPSRVFDVSTFKFTEISGQGMLEGDLPCPGSLEAGRCVLTNFADAILMCYASDGRCKSVTIYMNGTDGCSSTPVAVLSSASPNPDTTFVSQGVSTLLDFDPILPWPWFLYEEEGRFLPPTDAELAANNASLAANGTAWYGCVLGQCVASGKRVDLVDGVASPDDCCRLCSQRYEGSAAANASVPCNAWTHCEREEGCAWAGSKDNPTQLRLAKGQCQLQWQEISDINAGVPLFVAAKGEQSEFQCGSPVSFWAPDLPGFKRLPGRGTFLYGRYNCSGSLRPGFDCARPPDTLDNLAQGCLQDPRCLCMPVKQTLPPPTGLNEAGRPQLAWQPPKYVNASSRFRGFYKNAQDPEQTLFVPTTVLYVVDGDKGAGGTSGLSAGAIAGIVVGSTAVVAALAGLAWWRQRRRRQLWRQDMAAGQEAGVCTPKAAGKASPGGSSSSSPACGREPPASGASPARVVPLPPLSASPHSSGLSSEQSALPELVQHVEQHDAAAARSLGLAAQASEHVLLSATTLPPRLREWVVDPSAVEYLRWPNGSPIEIGRGASARVYKALLNGETVAAKEVDIGQSPALQEAFITECLRLQQLRHPNIVQLMGVTVSGAKGLVLLEYAEGRDLRAALDVRAAGTDERLFGWHRRGKRVALQLARALNYLHNNKNIVHLDVKSANVLLTAAGEARLADVGFSKQKLNTFLSDIQLTGTLAWAAPELLMGNQKVTSAVDVYSFGVVLWEIITGQRPQRGQLRTPHVPNECCLETRALLMECLDTDPAVRPTAGQLVARLNELVYPPAQPPPASVLHRLRVAADPARQWLGVDAAQLQAPATEPASQVLQAGTAGAAAAEHTTAANHVSSSPPLGGRAPLSFSAGAGGVLFAGSAWARGLHPAAGAGVSAAQPFETGMPAPPAQAQLQ